MSADGVSDDESNGVTVMNSSGGSGVIIVVVTLVIIMVVVMVNYSGDCGVIIYSEAKSYSDGDLNGDSLCSRDGAAYSDEKMVPNLQCAEYSVKTHTVAAV